MHQLLSISITYQIYKSFDAHPSLKARGVSFYISKAFDQIWHDGFLYKLKLLGISGRYYNLMQSFLNNRHQRVVLNTQLPKLCLVEAGVPQNSVLLPRPLLFLGYINLSKGLHCNYLLTTLEFCQLSLALKYIIKS